MNNDNQNNIGKEKNIFLFFALAAVVLLVICVGIFVFLRVIDSKQSKTLTGTENHPSAAVNGGSQAGKTTQTEAVKGRSNALTGKPAVTPDLSKSLTDCKKKGTDWDVEDCVNNVAMQAEDDKLCDELKMQEDKESCKNTIIIERVSKGGSLDECGKLSSQPGRAQCYAAGKGLLGGVNVCLQSIEQNVNGCLVDLFASKAKENKDKKFCDALLDDSHDACLKASS